MPDVDGKSRSPWGRWSLRWGLPSAVVALVSVWVLEPASLVGAIIAAGVALGALLVFVGTMPRRQPPTERRARRGAGE
ncbi:hypothetical protein PZB75_31680 (plasmid) [Streptomyces sp. AM 4-1-1]|uniref:hypothetical protein n=1 Tax=Streptomyces sp. AM 4-1-1 TaxID=3028710 RepID=UPI0023BA38A7|nr:hypothetical protein [Streptomyces sp. AM 4-1-1]WEH37963.1 hypothetical protein PZB75_31680 [Streptomyces sp. AM 4-1-1]